METGAAPACRLCGGEMRSFLDVDERFSLARCAACALVSTRPELPEEEVGPHYPPEYYGRRNRRFHPILEKLIVVFRGRRARLVDARARPGRVLDVGCGRGLLPSQLRRRGREAFGTELSAGAATHAREVLGIPVFVGPVEASPYAEGSFAAVVFWHVLEHLRDPRSALRHARRLLAPEGLLVVAVPNFESLQARVGGRGWFHLDVPRHYHHFGLGVLARLLDEEGFDVDEVSHFALEQNPYGWIQSLLNRLGLPANLLYAALKREGARDEAHPVRSAPFAFALTLLALVAIVPLSGLLFTAELLLRRGGTVEVWARRREAPAPAVAR
ncbi:MAG: class I SAM-dependent methyltransferase [Thermoanaerobaculia bacterium]